jgi:SAM-dependent methyltransferase/glycosyltransferase involved in cell wall biosynthesis
MKINFIFSGVNMNLDLMIELIKSLEKLNHDVMISLPNSDLIPEKLSGFDFNTHEDLFIKDDNEVIIYTFPDKNIYDIAKNIKSKIKICYILSIPKGLEKNGRFSEFKENIDSKHLILTNSTASNRWLSKKINIETDILFSGIDSKIKNKNYKNENSSIEKIYFLKDKNDEKSNQIINRIKTEYSDTEVINYENIKEDNVSVNSIFLNFKESIGWNYNISKFMLAKIPVISIKTGGVEDLIYHKKTGLIFSSKKINEINDLISFIKNDEKLKKKIIKNGYKHASQFQWKKSADYLLKIISNQTKKTLKNRLFSVIKKPQKLIYKIKKIFSNYSDSQFKKYEVFGAYHWEEYFNKKTLYKDHVDYILDLYKNKDTGDLLDVGCGDGLISHLLAKKGFNVKGIDLEESAVKLAEEKTDIVNFEIENLFNISNNYEYVLSSEVIEHIKNEDEFIKKIKDIFIKEAIITTPNKNYYKKMDPFHIKEYNIYEFELLLEKHFNEFEIFKTENHLYAVITR